MSKTKKTALVTGITGQDGSLLARLLLAKGYEVHGLKRRSSSFNTGRIDDLHRAPQDDDKSLQLHFCDITDSTNILRLIDKVRPDEPGYFRASDEAPLKVRWLTGFDQDGGVFAKINNV